MEFKYISLIIEVVVLLILLLSTVVIACKRYSSITKQNFLKNSKSKEEQLSDRTRKRNKKINVYLHFAAFKGYLQSIGKRNELFFYFILRTHKKYFDQVLLDSSRLENRKIQKLFEKLSTTSERYSEYKNTILQYYVICQVIEIEMRKLWEQFLKTIKNDETDYIDFDTVIDFGYIFCTRAAEVNKASMYIDSFFDALSLFFLCKDENKETLRSEKLSIIYENELLMSVADRKWFFSSDIELANILGKLFLDENSNLWTFIETLPSHFEPHMAKIESIAENFEYITYVFRTIYDTNIYKYSFHCLRAIENLKSRINPDELNNLNFLLKHQLLSQHESQINLLNHLNENIDLVNEFLNKEYCKVEGETKPVTKTFYDIAEMKEIIQFFMKYFCAMWKKQIYSQKCTKGFCSFLMGSLIIYQLMEHCKNAPDFRGLDITGLSDATFYWSSNERYSNKYLQELMYENKIDFKESNLFNYLRSVYSGQFYRGNS